MIDVLLVMIKKQNTQSIQHSIRQELNILNLLKTVQLDEIVRQVHDYKQEKAEPREAILSSKDYASMKRQVLKLMPV